MRAVEIQCIKYSDIAACSFIVIVFVATVLQLVSHCNRVIV